LADLHVVTGGAGFIGSHVVEMLLAGGHRVRVIDNFSTGRRSNLTAFRDDIELVEGDIRSYERAHRAVQGADYVVHLAALPSVPRSVQDPLTTNEVNVTGTLNVLSASRDAGVRRVVFASSSSVYGASAELPKRESLRPEPISPYGVSKLAGEQYCMAFHAVYQLETVALRYFNVFGPRQDPESQYSGVVALFLRLVAEGRSPSIFGDGDQTRDFTYVSNVATATLAATTAAAAAGHVINIACGERHSVNLLLAAVQAAVGRSPEPVYLSPREGDIEHSYADVSVAREILSYRPSVTLGEGIRLTYESACGASREA
jgi:nucleoside-diphosphate-sugar epimerase